MENHHVTKEGSKREERNKGPTKQPENNKQNGNIKSLPINNYFKRKWIKFPNEKTWNSRMKKTKTKTKKQYPPTCCL